MKKRSILIGLIVVIVFGAAALAVYLTGLAFDTYLEFQVRDAVSKNWVWDVTITLQDRTMRAYYQSDSGPMWYRFTKLIPGEAELTISAPAYEPKTVPVTLKKGKNRLEEPVDLVGVEIPNLDHFIIFEDLEGNDIVQEIRPVGEDGRAVLNHPCLDLWIGARVSVQMKGGLPVQTTTDEGSERGEELFLGKIEWSWDPLPETTFRYSARIPGAKIKNHPAPFRVIDYLIIVPDPREISPEELDELMEKAYKQNSAEELTSFLNGAKDKLRSFIFTSWNVEGAQ